MTASHPTPTPQSSSWTHRRRPCSAASGVMSAKRIYAKSLGQNMLRGHFAGGDGGKGMPKRMIRVRIVRTRTNGAGSLPSNHLRSRSHRIPLRASLPSSRPLLRWISPSIPLRRMPRPLCNETHPLHGFSEIPPPSGPGVKPRGHDRQWLLCSRRLSLRTVPACAPCCWRP